jgi:hypothetical protein
LKKLNRKNNNEKSDNLTVLVYSQVYFNQSYFNIVANQINFEDYSGKTERNHGFFISKFISPHGDCTLCRTSKKYLPDENQNLFGVVLV